MSEIFLQCGVQGTMLALKIYCVQNWLTHL